MMTDIPDSGQAIADEVEIRRIAESDSVEELTELLHRAYKILADMGFRFFATHQTPEQTQERIDSGECYVGIHDGRVIGTVTFYPPPRPESSGSEWYRRPDVSHFGQFAVEPSLQRSGVGSRLMDFVEDLARERGIAEIALDTAEGAHHLRDYYGRRGYRFIEYVQWDVTNYRSVVMSKNVGQAEQ